MSRFYGELEGSAKNRVTRRGSVASELVAHLRGWNIGVYVRLFVDVDGKDCIELIRTGGSNNPSGLESLSVIRDV